MNSNVKSATIAGLLGIFLGGVGAHNWYLGEKKKGIIHVSLVGGAILIMLIADAIIPAVFSLRTAFSLAGILAFLNLVSGLLMTGSSFWGFIEGIQILTKGDAGLAQRGFATAANPVAQPASQPMQAVGTAQGSTTMGAGAQSTSVQSGWQGETGNAFNSDGGTESNAEGNANAQNATIQNGTPVNGQPVAQQPKAPMDPAKKKKIIRGVIIGLAAVVVAVVVVVVITIVTRVSYSEAYRVAKEIKPEIAEFYQNTSCKRVLNYVDDQYTDVTTYNEYAAKCLAAGGEVSSLTKKLGETEGVKKNKEIKAQYDKFSEGIEKTLPNQSELEKRLDIYKAWHGFVATEVKTDSTNSEVEAKVAFLTNSGDETLKKYGEGWKERALALTQAYRDYDNLPYTPADAKSAARRKYQDLQSDLKNWVAANKPDVSQLGGLNFDDNTKIYNEWTKLYKLIQTTYEEHYDEKSGDCSELFGEVICD